MTYRLRLAAFVRSANLAVALTCGLSILPSVSGADQEIRAQLTARRFAVISAEIAAKIERIHIPESGTFAAGEPLVTFDDALPRAQLQRAQAVLEGAEKTYMANQRLLQLNSIGQIELELTQAEVAKARAELAYATAVLERCRIVAPFSGRMSEQRVREQEFVQPAQPVCEIIDDQLPQLDFIAPSKWLAWLKVGLPLHVQIDETGQSYSAIVERIGAKVDAVSQTVKVTAGVVGDHPELIAGMSGTIAVTPPSRL